METWDEFDVQGEFIGVPLKLRLRFYIDLTCGIQVLECPDEIGFDHLAIWDTSYCLRNDIRHLQGFINLSTPVVTAKLRFVANFDIIHGLNGKWFDCWHVDHSTGTFQFNTIPKEIEIQSNKSPLNPLAPGQYILLGAAVGGNGRIYHSRMTLNLHNDGKLHGHVQERLYPQTCALNGSWTPMQISWSMSYMAEGRVCDYMYFGSPAMRLLRGVWQLGDINSIDSLARESGRFDYELEIAHRLWSREYHHTFPQYFRHIAHEIIFSKAKDGAVGLPSEMWCQVFSFIHFDWFPYKY